MVAFEALLKDISDLFDTVKRKNDHERGIERMRQEGREKLVVSSQEGAEKLLALRQEGDERRQEVQIDHIAAQNQKTRSAATRTMNRTFQERRNAAQTDNNRKRQAAESAQQATAEEARLRRKHEEERDAKNREAREQELLAQNNLLVEMQNSRLEAQAKMQSKGRKADKRKQAAHDAAQDKLYRKRAKTDKKAAEASREHDIQMAEAKLDDQVELLHVKHELGAVPR
jgi:hypothetical protein